MKSGNTTFKWSFVALVIISGLMFHLFAQYLENLSNQQKIERLTSSLEEDFRDLKQVSDPNSFWARKLQQFFSATTSADQLQNLLSVEFARFNIKPGFVLFDHSKRIQQTNMPISHPEEWQKTAENLAKFCEQKSFSVDYITDLRERMIPDEDILQMRRLLGNLFFPRNIYLNTNSENPRLVLNEFSESAQASWIDFDKTKGLVCFFKQNDLSFSKILEPEFKRLHDKFEHRVNFSIEKGQADFSKRSFLTASKIKIEKQFLAGLFFRAETTLNQIAETNFFIKHKGVMVLLYFFLAMMVFSSCERWFYKSNPKFGILKKFLLLFFVANAVPLIPIAFLANDYLKDYRDGLVEDLKRTSFGFLQQVDKRFLFEETRQLHKIHSRALMLGESLKNRASQIDDFNFFKEKMQPPPLSIYLIASSTSIPVYAEGLMIKDGVTTKISQLIEEKLETFNIQDGFDLFLKSSGERATAVSIIIQAVMANLNATRLERNEQLRHEMFFDQLGFFDPTTILQTYFENRDKIFFFGFGTLYYRITIALLKCNQPDKFDYCVYYVFDEAKLQQEYIERSFSDLNRNNIGLKINVVHKHNLSWPDNLLENKDIGELAALLSNISPSADKKIRINGEEYLATAIKGEKTHLLKYISLYPVSRIDEKVSKQLTPIVGLWIAISLISFGFSLFLARSISEPIKELRKGVDALNSKNFSIRLEEKGKDEFSDLTRVFNRTLNDLEELQAAGFVQEKLLPQMSSAFEAGRICAYGKTRSLNDLGGDYFDILSIGEKTGIIVGDVAGHGVAAAMIMAFVKSCVFTLSYLYLKPLDFVNRLNLLFRTTRSKKQKKFMSLQYLLFNEDASFTFVNAGHCYPLLFDSKSREIQQLKMINSPLGTSAKLFKEEHSYQLQPGQSVILYSDGYYEVGDLGFEPFCEILKETWDNDPQKYYQNIEQRISAIIGSCEETDDKTLIIISRKHC